VATTGCQQREARGTDIVTRDSAGIEIVQSPGADHPLNWRFTESFRLGGADAGPASFYQIEPRDVKTDQDGRIYVLDRANYRVVLFSSTGEYLRSFGRRGGGPGEISVPAALSVGPDGTISVMDYSKGGLVRFGADGSALQSTPIELPYSGGRMVHTERGLLLNILEGYLEGYRSTDQSVVYDRLVLLGVDGGTVEIASLERNRPRMVRYTGCVGIDLAPLFGPELNWDADGDRIAVNDTTAYVVDMFRGERRIASYRRDLSLRSVDRDDALAELGKGKTVVIPGGRCRIDPVEELEGRGYADRLPAISALAVSPDGMIWVRRGSFREEAALIDLLDRDGRYLGTLPAGSPFPVAFISSDTLIVKETDEFDIEYIVAYSISREA